MSTVGSRDLTTKLSTGDGLYTPMSRRLFDAIKDSKVVQVKSLVLKYGLSINTKNQREENGLIEALRIEDDRRRRITFSFLLKCGIDAHHRDNSDRDALEWAGKLGRVKQALQLLNGPMIEYDFLHKDCDGFTLLHYATINNMEQVVKTILKRLTRYYISVDIPDSYGLTPYLHAKRLNHDKITFVLLSAGASKHILIPGTESKSNSEKHDDKMNKIVQLKINGRLPQLRNMLTVSQENISTSNESSNGESHGFHGRYHHMTDNINSLLQLNQLGETCERFVNSTNIADIDSTHSAAELAQSTYMSSSNSVTDLNDIFDIMSEQMTQSFCRPAQPPKPKQMIFQKNKPAKRSTLAAIMGKPAVERPSLQASDRRKSHLRKSSRNDMMNKLKIVPTIKTTSVDL